MNFTNLIYNNIINNILYNIINNRHKLFITQLPFHELHGMEVFSVFGGQLIAVSKLFSRFEILLFLSFKTYGIEMGKRNKSERFNWPANSFPENIYILSPTIKKFSRGDAWANNKGEGSKLNYLKCRWYLYVKLK